MRENHRVNQLRKDLLTWGSINTKVYPWRQTTDPYLVLVAEFMLHRTQVPQVQVVYEQFVQLYPHLEDFVQGSNETILEILYPLGLHWRIKGMINALFFLWQSYKCVPTELDKLLAVPGIGPYIAGATVCFSQNQPMPLIDTNTVRVIGRIFGLELKGEARRRKDVINTISYSCDPKQPRNYYYAIIDLAHTICKVDNPYCSSCPLLNVPCQFGQQNSF